MPKLLVVLDPASASAARLADHVAEGARGVRFTEVEVRALGAGSPHRPLSDDDDLARYDAIAIGASAGAPALESLLARCASKGGLVDRVVAHFGADAAAGWDALRSVAALGVLVVPADASADESARALGARLAKVAEWVRHAKSHEAKPGHSHGQHHH